MKEFKSKEELLEEVAKGGVVVADFYGAYCQPCKALKPRLEKLQEKHGDVIIGAMDIENDFDFVVENKIMHVPAIFFYKNGEKVAEILKNVTVKEIEEKIAEIK